MRQGKRIEWDPCVCFTTPRTQQQEKEEWRESCVPMLRIVNLNLQNFQDAGTRRFAWVPAAQTI